MLKGGVVPRQANLIGSVRFRKYSTIRGKEILNSFDFRWKFKANTVCPSNTYGISCRISCMTDKIRVKNCSKLGAKICHKGNNWSIALMLTSVRQVFLISGFDGKHCKDVNECKQLKPCKNGGQCQNTIGSFHCAYIKPFHHIIGMIGCALRKPCRNKGKCMEKDGYVFCICPKNYEGETCSNDVDECKSNPCENGATCVNLKGSFKCFCPRNFIGKFCDVTLMKVWQLTIRIFIPSIKA